MLSNWLTAIGVMAAVASGIAALLAVIIQLRIFNKQLTIQIYSDYTKRFQEVVLSLPESAFDAKFKLSQGPDYDRLMVAMRIYFDLCFEEWHLHERKLVNEDIWRVWRKGMQIALYRPAFFHAWPVIKNSSAYGEKFDAFIDKLNPDMAGLTLALQQRSTPPHTAHR
jgi:hypothetical protein